MADLFLTQPVMQQAPQILLPRPSSLLGSQAFMQCACFPLRFWHPASGLMFAQQVLLTLSRLSSLMYRELLTYYFLPLHSIVLCVAVLWRMLGRFSSKNIDTGGSRGLRE